MFFCLILFSCLKNTIHVFVIFSFPRALVRAANVFPREFVSKIISPHSPASSITSIFGGLSIFYSHFYFCERTDHHPNPEFIGEAKCNYSLNLLKPIYLWNSREGFARPNISRFRASKSGKRHFFHKLLKKICIGWIIIIFDPWVSNSR